MPASNLSISIFLPVRKGSERVKNKNTRKFAEYSGGLLEFKLKQLLRVKGVEEVVVSTNDIKCIQIAEKFKGRYENLRVEERPDELGASSTTLSDLIAYVPNIVHSDHILWTHVTSPFCDDLEYHRIIEAYWDAINNGFDSLMTGEKFQNFLWDRDQKQIINKKSNDPWPRTQELKEFFEINSAAFLAPRSLYLEKNERIGENPFLFNMHKISSLDIDEEEDFKIAEAVYERIKK